MTELVGFRELQRDLELVPGVRTKLFEEVVNIPTGDRLISIGLQGGCYLNWFNASPNLSLRLEVGILRTTIINPVVTVSPTPGGELPPTSATGTVRFVELESGTVIPLGASIQRIGVNGPGGMFVAQAMVEEADGTADVPVRAMAVGRDGNAPAGTAFGWERYGNGAAIADFIGGEDMRPNPSQIVHRVGTLILPAEHATGPIILGEVWITDVAIRTALPGVPLPDKGWTLMGKEHTDTIIDPRLRWPWRVVVEDLGPMEP